MNLQPDPTVLQGVVWAPYPVPTLAPFLACRRVAPAFATVPDIPELEAAPMPTT